MFHPIAVHVTIGFLEVLFKYFHRSFFIRIIFFSTNSKTFLNKTTIIEVVLLGEMGTVEMNMSMFFIGGLAAACTIPPTGAPAESIRLSAVLAVLALGAITGLGFLLQAEAFRTVPVFTATIIQSSTVLLSLLWATLLWKETITVHIILGTALFLFGILLANLF